MRKYFTNSVLIALLLGAAWALPFLLERSPVILNGATVILNEVKDPHATTKGSFALRAQDDAVINFWQYWSGSEREPMLELVRRFNAEDHGFKVKMLSISMPRKKILMAVTAGVPPDLVHLDGDMVTDFALRNALSEITIQDSEKFIPVYLRMLNIHGKQWALPLMPTCEAMHINKGLLDRYGLSVPRTLEDLVVAFDTVGVNSSDVAWLPSWPPWAGRFIPIVFGGSWGDEEHITANSPENIRAWTWVQENFARKIPRDRLAAFTEGFKAYQSPDNPFYAGRIAIENSGVWERNLATKFAPKMNVVVAAFPHASQISRHPERSEGSPSFAQRIGIATPASRVRNDYTLVSVDALAIPRGAKHPELAKKFAEWLLEPEQVEYLARAQAKFSPLRETSSKFIANHPNPYIETFIALANSPHAIYFPQLSCVQRYRREIGDAYNRVLRMEVTAKQALDDLQKTMEVACQPK